MGLGSWALGVGGWQLGVVPFVDREERVDYYAGAASALIGVVPLLVLPLTAMEDARSLEGKRAAGTDCRVLLPDAEAMLGRSAVSQAEGRAWWNHVANVIVNGGTGLLLGLAYDHWGAGIFSGVAGIAIGEAMIYTQPIDSVADLAQYQRNEWHVAVVPMLSPRQVGLQLALGF